MWNIISREQQANVQINIQNNACGDAPACWNRFNTDIYLDAEYMTRGRGIQLLLHEYGHYVNWTYGSFSDWCWPGSDEGDAIHETFADLAGLLFIARGSEIASTYNQAGLVVSQFPGRHRDGSPTIVYDPENCNVAPYNEHNVGKGLEQAFWEVLWNQDCATGDACASGLSTFGDDIFLGAYNDRGTVNNIVAEATARTLQATGSDVTFDEIVHTMCVRVGSLTDAATRARFEAVMIHHGFDP